MRPRIGLNMTLVDMDVPLKEKAVCHLRYIDAVADNGGIPILLPPYSDRSMLFDAVQGLDGFLFIGGPDYRPEQYGGHKQPESDLMHARRHQFDIWLAEIVMKQSSLPTLGICGGHQLMNLAYGGALIQDLASEWKAADTQASTLQHSDSERCDTPQAGNVYRHEVKIEAGSLLSKIIGSNKVLTNSYHHQAAAPDRLGTGLKPTAWSPDGVIEALELQNPEDRFFLGVQWHPERQTDEPEHRRIFEALVEASKK
jgi:putative glutamine amidotransferase